MWRNDWSTLNVPDLGRWRPTRSVSVVIPAYRCQATLDLTLAALSAQTYPADLLEVVVVDDGSTPPIELPAIRPAACRVIRNEDGWGRASALHYGAMHSGAMHSGAMHSDGDVIHWLDADMIPFPEHIEAQLRWHDQIPYAVTLGYKRMVDAPAWPSAREVFEACANGTIGKLFAPEASQRHEYVEALIDASDQLRAADHIGFLVHVGATATLRRQLYRAAGGLNATLRLGEDTEFGYRLAQAGAAFIPEPQARSWHLGRTHVMELGERVKRYNKPFLADLMPHPRWLRKVGGSGWSVPLVTVVVPAQGPVERVRAVVDSILANTQRDLRVLLVGGWGGLGDERMSVLTDPLLDLRLVAATYQGDPRVRLVESAPATAFPSPYLLTLPTGRALAPVAIGRLIDLADRDQLGLVRVPGPAGGEPVRLWRTAAVSRAVWDSGPAGDLDAAGSDLADLPERVTRVWGARDVPASVAGVIDLAGFTDAQLAEGIGTVDAGPGRYLPSSVEVAGVRSLARAGVVVARVSSRRAWSKVRRLTGVRRKKG